jgi:hypothetical protein
LFSILYKYIETIGEMISESRSTVSLIVFLQMSALAVAAARSEAEREAATLRKELDQFEAASMEDFSLTNLIAF